jgi:hypothetical protein
MRYAAELGLDLERFEEDLANDNHAWGIEEDRLGGDRAGVRGTPAFFVNGVRYTGTIDLDGLLAAVEEATSSSNASQGRRRQAIGIEMGRLLSVLPTLPARTITSTFTCCGAETAAKSTGQTAPTSFSASAPTATAALRDFRYSSL